MSQGNSTSVAADPVSLAYAGRLAVDPDQAIARALMRFVLLYVALRTLGFCIYLHTVVQAIRNQPAVPWTALLWLAALSLLIVSCVMLSLAMGGARRWVLPAAIALAGSWFLGTLSVTLSVGQIRFSTYADTLQVGMAVGALLFVHRTLADEHPFIRAISPFVWWGSLFVALLPVLHTLVALGDRIFATAGNVMVMAMLAAFAIGGWCLLRHLTPAKAYHLRMAIALGVIGVIVVLYHVGVATVLRFRTESIAAVILAIAPFVLLIGLNVVARRVASEGARPSR